MSIVYISVDEAAEVGELPRTNKMISTDSLSVISQPGYLNKNNTSGRNVFPTDVWHVQYNYTGNSFAQQAGFGSGTFGIFTTSVSPSGVITLTEWINPGDILLPVNNGNIPVFNGVGGQIKDSGSSISSGVSLNYIAVPVTGAQFLGMYASPVLIVPSLIGVANIIRITSSLIYYTYGSTQLAAGGSVRLQYGSAAFGAGPPASNAEQAADFIAPTSNTNYWFVGTSGNGSYTSDVSNNAVYLTNQTAAFTGGTGASFVVHVWYYVTTTP